MVENGLQLIAEAKSLREQTARRASHPAKFERLRAIGQEALARGGSDSVIAALAQEHGTYAETVRAHMKDAGREARAQARKARDLEIVRLARRGLTNAEIGKRVGCSPRTVTRAIAAAFRAPKNAGR